MAQARALTSSIPFDAAHATEHISGAARAARERALAAGLTVTTHKEGRLVQEKMVEGRVIELFKRCAKRKASDRAVACRDFLHDSPSRPRPARAAFPDIY